MPTILLTILNYISLRSIWQADQMRDSETLMNQQMQSGEKMSQLGQKEYQEQSLLEAQLDEVQNTNADSSIITRLMSEIMAKMNQLANEYDTKRNALMCEQEAAERNIQQRIDSRTTRLQAVDADIKNLNEALDKRTEEQFKYMQT